MIYPLIPLIIGALLLSIFLYFRVKERRVIAVIFKAGVSLSFIATALVAWLTSNNPNTSFGIFILIGLFFGLLGDVFLDLKYIILSKEKFYTCLGFIAFAIGHVFYCLGLFLNFFKFETSILYIIIPIVFTIIATVATLLMEKFTPIKYKEMKPFVIMYGMVLFFTVSIYFSSTIQSGWQNTTLILMSIGLVLFAISDLILNNT